MPNGHDTKKYGKHKYADHDGTSDCEFGCGCWAGASRSGGPLGLDPLGGFCPNNPEDDKLLGGKDDYEHVVNARITDLEHRAFTAETQLKKVSPTKKKLADHLSVALQDLNEKTATIQKIRFLVAPESCTPKGN